MTAGTGDGAQRHRTGAQEALATDDLTAVAAGILEADSDLIRSRQAIDKRADNVFGLLLRQLAREEIAIMEQRGCRADDWERVRVAQDFDPFRVRRAFFAGDCVLGRFSGTVALLPGREMPCGVYDCVLRDCQIGNDCLVENVRYADHVLIEHDAVCFDLGSITCNAAARFGCGQELPIAIETGGREVPLWAEMMISDAAAIARERGDAMGLQRVRSAIASYCTAIESSFSWVRRGARVLHTNALTDVYVGEGAIIHHALQVRNVAVLSNADEVTSIAEGASVKDSVLQWGVEVKGTAEVEDSALLEHSGVATHAAVETSIIGPNTHIEKGEVTASLVGPFVGFHHQSLLIAACWPEGRGNIAYGAMVGSNHTGRAPDQEIWPGEGCFFGLGCSIRFPTNLSESPYSVISAGVSTLPQRVAFPFSLIHTPVEAAEGQPRAYNELLPGWALTEGLYGLVRAEQKYKQRDAAKRHRFSYQVLRPSIMRLVDDALQRLEGVQETKPIYTEIDIPGIGKNFLREEARQAGIEAYSYALKRYALRVLLADAEGFDQIPGSVDVAQGLIDRFMPGSNLSTRMLELLRIERVMAERVQASKWCDHDRGERIIPGYGDAHDDGPDDKVVVSAWERVASTEKRINALL